MEEKTPLLASLLRNSSIHIAVLAALAVVSFSTYIVSYAQTAPQAVLDAPVLAAEASEGGVELTWTAVQGAARYELLVWWDSETGWVPLDEGDLTGTTFLHSDLDTGITYFYLVRGVSSSGESGEWSEQVYATLADLQPTLAPPILTAVATEGLVELSWTLVDSAVGYELYAWTSWEGWQRLDEGDLGTTTFSHTGLLAGMTYFYVVRAIGESGGASEWAQQVSATVPGYLVVPDVPEERAALVALFEATGGANWRRSDNWLSELSIANWHGVSTDQHGHVTRLFLENNGLEGTIPDLSALTSLTSLNLGFNMLNGPIPDLSAQTSLTYISLRENQLTGSVSELNSLVSLTHVYLDNNRLTGQIPDLGSLTGLTSVYLSDNRLTGPIPDLGALTSLTRLDLGSNQLTGPVPDLCSLTNLTHVYLGPNQLTGTIPDLCDLAHLEALHLSNNQLTGPIPDLSALSSLEILYLSDNRLTGSIPDLSALTNLWRVSLGSNQLIGSVPDLDGLTNLTQIFLDNNLLSGSIPDLGSLPKLTDVDLSNNDLEGPVPELGALLRLTTLRLSSNRLTGSVPVLSGLLFLKDIDFSKNGLTGGMPDLSALFRLETLDFSENGLEGPVPSLGDLERLTAVSLRDNQLTGPIPDLSALTNLRWLLLDSNQLAGQIPDLSLFADLKVLNLSNNQLEGPVVELGALEDLTRISLKDNLLAGLIPDFTGLTKLIDLKLTGNQFCLARTSDGSVSNAYVKAHLESLSLATCSMADLAAAPAVPRNLKAIISDGKVMLGWDAAPNGVSYDLRVWDSIDRRWRLIGDALTDTQFTHDALTDGRNYHYQVRARDANGVRGAWSTRLFAAVVAQQFSPPPLSLEIDLFYQKYLETGGVIVVGPSDVSDQKMVQAREIITGVLSSRSDLLDTLAANEARIEYFGYWREAAGEPDGWVAHVSVNDPNCGDFLQEFAHLIRQALEVQSDGQEFMSQLESVYQAALDAGLWKGSLAATHVEAYWAATVKYWFWEALPPSLAGEHLMLADYDAEVTSLIEDVFGDASVPLYCKP